MFDHRNIQYAQLNARRLRIICLPKAFTNKIKIIITCISFRGPCPEGKIIMMENQGQILSSCSWAISRMFETITTVLSMIFFFFFNISRMSTEYFAIYVRWPDVWKREFPYICIWGKFSFLFPQCRTSSCPKEKPYLNKTYERFKKNFKSKFHKKCS